MTTTKAAYTLKPYHSAQSPAPEGADIFLKLCVRKAKPKDMKSVLRKAPRAKVVETDR